jgi:oligopeptide/dipeptide ABC transporter ATP-binding protein
MLAAPASGARVIAPLLEIIGLEVHYPFRRGVLARIAGHVHAVDGVDLAVLPGEILGIVGESGCGKTTLGRALVGLVRPTKGSIRLAQRDITVSRRPIQMVFQDSVGSLNPRFRIRDSILEGARIQRLIPRGGGEAMMRDALHRVGLRPELADRFPHQLSGGQRQRVGIARTLLLQPQVIVADEPVSALDVSIQSQILNLLAELQRETGITCLFISHNLAAVSYLADRIAVMYLGRIVELLDARGLYRRARHPYTIALLSALLDPAQPRRDERLRIEGDPPSPIDPPSGCRFRTRCPIARPMCAADDPALLERGGEHPVACHFPGELPPPAWLAEAEAA